jgi:RNA polymerase sigma-70 factor (ECF subfamily)
MSVRDAVTGNATVEWTESTAIAGAKQGDAAAFEWLYKAHSKRVYSLCLRMLRNTAEAEDLTQQVFLKLFRKIGSFRGDSGFSTWLYRVAFNAVLMHLRRRKPDESLIDGLDHSEAGGADSCELERPDISARGVIDRLNLTRAIHKLPDGYRRFFLLHDVIGYKHTEIAGLLGCSTGCSKSQLHKARKWLRRLLRGEVVRKRNCRWQLEQHRSGNKIRLAGARSIPAYLD